MFFKMQFLSFGAVVVAGSSLVAERRLVAGQVLVASAGLVDSAGLVASAGLADFARKKRYDEWIYQQCEIFFS
jgi:hypothetical protein